MPEITKLHLRGFKKYKEHTSISFNKQTNILIGDNDSGKSSILQALAIILKGKYNAYASSTDNSYANFLNSELIDNFELNKMGWTDSKKLPYFRIVLEFKLESIPENVHFFGENIPEEVKAWEPGQEGIVFEYKFNDEFETEYSKYVKDSQQDERLSIPFDLYSATWKTFGGSSYKPRQDPFKSILIDNDNWNGDPFNAFSKQIFGTLPDDEKRKMRMSYRTAVSQVYNANESEFTLRINPNSTSLESILDVTNSKKVSIRHLGSGNENLIKTDLAIASKETQLVLIEEPENHLSAGNTKRQIQNIQNRVNFSQILITTHNPQIINRMGINNAIWINNSKTDSGNEIVEVKRFNDLEPKTVEFFRKLDNLDFTRILSTKYVVLVEGASEYILMDTFLNKINSDKAPQVEVISYSGRYYQPFLELSKLTNSKTVIFTDNDKENSRLEQISAFNENSENVKVFSGSDLKSAWTFEVAIYQKNELSIERTPFSTRVPDQKQYMLNNKTKTALDMVKRFENNDLEIPDYITDGIEWLFDDAK